MVSRAATVTLTAEYSHKLEPPARPIPLEQLLEADKITKPMKTSTTSFASATRGLTFALAALLFGPVATQAALPVIPAGEHLLFADDFDDNNNAWSNIGTGNNEATIGADPNPNLPGVTSWYPSVTSVSASFPGVYSLYRLTNAANLAYGDISVFMRARVDYAAVNQSVMAENNKFTLVLAEDNGAANAILNGTNALAQLIIKPSASSAPAQIGYTGFDTNGILTNQLTSNLSLVRVPDTNTFVDFRLLLSLQNETNLVISAWRYTNASAYVLLGLPVTNAYPGSGLFPLLQIMCRNGGTRPDKRAFFDSVAVTQPGPRLRLPAWAANTFSFQFGAYSNNSYTVQYRDDLGAGTWQPLVTTNGSGGWLPIADGSASASNRCYRVRWE
jgi:hypothetical protein